MRYHAAAFLLAFSCLAYHPGDSYTKDSRTHSHEWKKLVLTHHWPVSVCKMDDVTCESPPNYWTLHGLWPDKAEMCNNSWHFNKAEIEDLLPDMNKFWPDVLHPNQSQLWKHEWQKHGTCAASLSCLDSQHKYFGTSLELYKKTDLNSFLEKSGIVPSTKYYRIADIRNAVHQVYGVIPKIQCFPLPEQEDTQVLTQIEICFTKELQPRNCSGPGEDALQGMRSRPVSWNSIKEELSVCNETLQIYYPPMGQLWV
ncbi:ribonuclease T2 [Pleurodeles waltl]